MSRLPSYHITSRVHKSCTLSQFQGDRCLVLKTSGTSKSYCFKEVDPLCILINPWVKSLFPFQASSFAVFFNLFFLNVKECQSLNNEPITRCQSKIHNRFKNVILTKLFACPFVFTTCIVQYLFCLHWVFFGIFWHNL